MKIMENRVELDSVDFEILRLLQVRCKTPLAKIGEQVGLSAPAVVERVRRLEDGGMITAYVARLDARKLGLDITAFIGVTTAHPGAISSIEEEIAQIPEVLECHHVTGGYTLMLKIKTTDTSGLGDLIRHIRSCQGVERTETMVVLSTHTEHGQLPLPAGLSARARRRRRNGEKGELVADKIVEA